MKRHLATLVKFSVVFVLFYYLYQKDLISFAKTKDALTNLTYSVPAFALLAVSICIGFVRWHFLIRAQGIPIKFSRTLQFSFIGNFFNIALPGAVSGDVIKAMYIGKEYEGKRAQAFSSILFDRLTGVSAQVLLSAGCLLFLGTHDQWNSNFMSVVSYVLMISGAGVIGFFSYLFFLKLENDPLLKILDRIQKRWPVTGSFYRIYEGVQKYGDKKGPVIGSILVSLGMHSLVVIAFWLFLQASGESHVAIEDLFVVIPLGLIVTAIPIMPAGIGTGHAAFTFLLLSLGSERGADIFNLYIIFQLANGAVGSLIYIRFKGKPVPDGALLES